MLAKYHTAQQMLAKYDCKDNRKGKYTSAEMSRWKEKKEVLQ
jgi:hypothetical protein